MRRAGKRLLAKLDQVDQAAFPGTVKGKRRLRLVIRFVLLCMAMVAVYALWGLYGPK